MSCKPIPRQDLTDISVRRYVDEEAHPGVDEGDHVFYADSAFDEETTGTEPFDPFVPLGNVNTGQIINIVTPRAILLGSFCGALVNASNIYLGLRAGWTTSANILGVRTLCIPIFHMQSLCIHTRLILSLSNITAY